MTYRYTPEEIGQLNAEIDRLRAALAEIAGHYIDSALASMEKRQMARRVLNGANGQGTASSEPRS